jgi:hypothetical protein
MTSNHSRLLVLLALIGMAATMRLVPHPPNFTPIGAIALFSGSYFGRRPLAYAAALGALLLSDAVLGFYAGISFQYAAVALITFLGSVSLRRVSVLRIIASALGSSFIFFTISNFGTWMVSGLYPRDATGFAACYVAAIPFFQNTMAGDLFYACVLFGGFTMAERMLPSLRLEKSEFA